LKIQTYVSGGVAPVVEGLPSKHKDLSSNPSTEKIYVQM
jgi:hypothetical protein